MAEMRIIRRIWQRIKIGAQGLNIINGYAGNDITGSTDASTIGGGGISGSEQIISAGSYNTIGGGYDDQITSSGIGASTISGGAHHRISGTSDHGTIGGGSTHTINGAAHYATIGGGSTNTANADSATVAGGTTNSATGVSSSVGGGTTNTASGVGATVAGGSTNTASANGAAVVGGSNNTAHGGSSVAGGASNAVGTNGSALGDYAGAFGLSNTIGAALTSRFSYALGRSNIISVENALAHGYGAKAAIIGAHTHAGGFFAAAGDAQSSVIIDRISTTDATVTELRPDGSTARLTLANDTTWMFTAMIVARRTDVDGESAAYKIEGCIDRNTNAASTALVGTITKTVVAEDTAAWDVDATADTTNGSLKITVTGEAAKTIRWVARVTLVEVTG